MTEFNMNVSPQRYVNLMSDSGFKAVFGDENNKDIVIDFLNVVFNGERVVTDIEHIKGELSGKTTVSKGVRFDLICRGDDGTSFIVEMQRGYKIEDFFQRSVYYGSKVYEIQRKSGDENYLSKPVYVIGIMEHELIHEHEAGRESVLSYYRLAEKESGIVAPSTISCIFVQLGNFKMTHSQCVTDIDRWCYTMKQSADLTAMPDEFADTVELERLYEACEIAQFDQDKRLKYEKDMMTELDYRHDLYYSRKEGLEEGEKIGENRGRQEATQTVAKNMKSIGIDMASICKCTGLTEEQVNAL